MNKNMKDLSLEPQQEGSSVKEASGESSEKRHRSHHSHHHHHHSHGSSKSKYRRKLKRFFRQNKKKIMNIGVFVLLIGALLFWAIHQDAIIRDLEESNRQVATTDSSIRVETTLFSGEVPLVVDAVTGYLDSSNKLNAEQVYNQFHDELKYSDIAVPFTFAYDVVGLPAQVVVESGILEVAENGDFSRAVDHKLYGHSGKTELFNLKTGVKYSYRLTLTLSNHITTGTFGEFTTKASPRWMKIDGLKNVRDIGGWKTEDGKTLKQGLLYRGIELDGASESAFKLTPEGLEVMIDTLGIRFDMDLRSSSVNATKVDALGAGVLHKYYPISNYTDVLQADHNERVRKIFSDLANKNNYPVYLHCTYGRDRTGTVCYLLEGLLGVSKEDATKDYELSAFSGLGIDTESFRKFQNQIDSFQGNTFQQKVEGYLLSVGITPAEINSIQNIFLGE